ncbi:FecR domain-containing protein [Aliifodinibius salicampi]|uniref:FecR domain-containing protein n=1 Tax=Fodinibius salicampi TaxID=1920655 RepID=A0ABT3Q163_9BACT|nr:FecR domain-containing protein [Fodinibius salicampi]MCW9713778.1 FecR domain-containing protein [Fodinibius salicampi]
MADQLPHNDKDLQLAQSIGRARNKETSLDSISSDDPLVTNLLSYRKQKIQSAEIDDGEKRQVWDDIASATQSSSESNITKLFHTATLRWAAAAVLLIGALISFIYLEFYQQPELLAESQTTITTVNLSDGSTVTLRPHSQLFLLKQDRSVQRYKLDGEGFFEVTTNAERTFSVETEIGRVSVLGTSFTVSSWGRQTQVYLQEGAVKIEALQQDSSIVLEPGQSASVTNINSVPTLQSISKEEFLDWLDRQLVFENRPANLIIGELEQEFNISITIPEETGNKKLTGQLSLQNLETALQDLEIVLGGTFTQTGDQSYTFETQ